MKEDFPFAVCCTSCGSLLSRSFTGTRTITHCPKCGAELFYEVSESGPYIKMIKGPKNPPKVSEIPA